jgi:hypothetical protein
MFASRDDPNLIHFCDRKICRMYPQSPRHTITITHSESLWLVSSICQCNMANRLNIDIHRFIVSQDGYLCALATSGKITLLRLVPFSKISKVINLQNSWLHNCVPLCLQVVVGTSSASGKLQFVFHLSSTVFVNDFTDFQVTVNICLV